MFPLLFGLLMFAMSVTVEILVPGEANGPAALVASVVDRSGKLLGTIMMFLFAQTLVVEVAGDTDRDARLRRS